MAVSQSRFFKEWVQRKWQDWTGQETELGKHYLATFTTPSGRTVLQHLMDTQYCIVYEGIDPIAIASFNARRSVIHDILVTLDAAEHPSKYRVKVEEGEHDVRMG